MAAAEPAPLLPVDSHWEASAGPPPALLLDPARVAPLAGDADSEVAIIGGGYTGLGAALELAGGHSTAVRVLEAGPLGWGASGRNGGFATIGATKLSGKALVARHGRDAAAAFYTAQREAVDWVRGFARDEGADIGIQGDGVVSIAHRPGAVAELEAERAFYTDVAGLPCRLLSRAQADEELYAGPEQHGALHVGLGFGLHPLKYYRALAVAACRSGAVLHPHSRVTRWERDGGRHLLHTANGRVRARRVIVACNGYPPEALEPRLRGLALPALSNIIVTKPLSAAELAAQGWRSECPMADTRNLLFYYRLLADARFLLGARGGLSPSSRAQARMRRWLTGRLGRMFPAWRMVAVERFWSGHVCLTRALVPFAGPLPEVAGAWAAFGYHGSGVALSAWTGRALARELATGQRAIPAVMRGPPRRFPLPALRPLYLGAAYLGFAWRDRFG